MADRNNEGKPEWMTLGRAASTLGVSESTVRRWVDAGEVRSFRTKGGHRRILVGDLDSLIPDASPRGARDAERVSDVATARVRRRLTRRPSESLSALAAFSEPTRARLRLLGWHLVDLFAHHLTARGKRGQVLDEAPRIGHEYGRLMGGEEVGLSTAIAAFNSPRRSLEAPASQLAAEQ